MNEDIKTGLDAELPSGSVPFSLDTDEAVRLGRRSRKHRRLAAVGGSVLSVAAVTALVLTVLTPGGLFSGGQDNAAAGDELPDLDPKLRYEWLSGADTVEDTPVTKAYDEAFWSHWNAEHPEARPDHKQYQVEGQPTQTPKEEPRLRVDQRELVEWKGDTGETIYKHSLISLQVEYGDENSSITGPMGFQFGDGMPNFVDVQVIPDGRFRIGTEDVYDLAWCDDDEDAFTDDCEVTKTTGPDGERIENVLSKEIRTEDDKLSGVGRKTIVYRADGSAVVVSDTINGEHGGVGPDEEKDLGDAKPALSFEELTAIALALPEKPLE